MKRRLRRAAQWAAVALLCACGAAAIVLLLCEPAEGVDVVWTIVWTRAVGVAVLYAAYRAGLWCLRKGLIPDSVYKELTEKEEDAL